MNVASNITYNSVDGFSEKIESMYTEVVNSVVTFFNNNKDDFSE